MKPKTNAGIGSIVYLDSHEKIVPIRKPGILTRIKYWFGIRLGIERWKPKLILPIGIIKSIEDDNVIIVSINDN